MGLVRIVIVAFMGLNALSSYYSAGKFAAGHKEVKQGKAYAWIYGISATISGLLAIGLLLDL